MLPGQRMEKDVILLQPYHWHERPKHRRGVDRGRQMCRRCQSKDQRVRRNGSLVIHACKPNARRRRQGTAISKPAWAPEDGPISRWVEIVSPDTKVGAGRLEKQYSSQKYHCDPFFLCPQTRHVASNRCPLLIVGNAQCREGESRDHSLQKVCLRSL